ncbi:hypothetical protein CDD81_595 [Ophiocordyceps australis]|uniref:Uncharacterized protein n=1 Tax=Ophiocordyceps australis TaxID=1399860 RepID=A0A2C5YF15_9HYPO|nr:hypothetical protein CDD81_595 [Ophiocordyceps australis]
MLIWYRGKDVYHVINTPVPNDRAREPANFYILSTLSLSEITADGGFAPPLTIVYEDEAFGYNTFGNTGGPWIFVVAQEIMEYALRESDDQGVLYAYEISTSPNMVLSVHPARGYVSAWALGGVVLSQPQLSGFLHDHPIWHEQQQYGWTGAPAAGMTRRREALMFMNTITADNNVRTLLHWSGTFPMLRSETRLADTTPGNAMDLTFPWQTVDIPRELLERITIGRLTNEQCMTAIEALFYSFWRLRTLGSGKYSEGEVCEKFSRVKFQLSLSNGPSDGTSDSIILDLPIYRFTTIVQGPGPGYSQWHELDILKLYGNDTIQAQELYYVDLVTVGHSHPFKRESWRLKGLKLRAKCADLPLAFEVDKFSNLDLAVERLEHVWTHSAWTGIVDIGDWHSVEMNPTQCELLSLDVKLKLGDSWVAGTWDDIVIFMGREEVTLAIEPYRTAQTVTGLNLWRAYGLNRVPLQVVQRFSLTGSPRSKLSGDWFQVQDIIFTGRCANSERTVVNNKYKNINTWINHFDDNDFRLDGVLRPEDWQWANPDDGADFG